MNRRVAPIPLSLVLLAAIEPAAGAGLDPGPPARVVAADGPDRAARQPQVAVDEAGRVFVAFGVGDTIRCAASADGGRTFEARTVGSAGVLALGMRRGPRIAAAGKTVVVTAVCGTEGKGRDGDLLAWRSADAGRTWAGPARVNSIAGSAREGLHGMAGGPGGAVFCTWLDLRDKGSQIYGARSRDGGATWEPDHLIYRAPGGKVCECCHPSAALAPDGTVCVMWRNQLEGARDLYLARSADGGRSFGPAEKLGRGTWLLNACPMDGGAVAVGPDGAVESAWTRAGAVYLARPGAAEHRLGPGVQGWIAAGPGRRPWPRMPPTPRSPPGRAGAGPSSRSGRRRSPTGGSTRPRSPPPARRRPRGMAPMRRASRPAAALALARALARKVRRPAIAITAVAALP